MKTPIKNFGIDYAKKKSIRFHMPGHKGRKVLGCEKYDITEIDGADVLYNSDGIIKESENLSQSLFGSGKTLYSTEGSSLCIRAMIYLVKIYAKALKKDPVILAGRNAHKTFSNCTALSDVPVVWMYGQSKDLLSCKITPDDIENYIKKHSPVAVYITSPDYLGNISDIREISRVCKRHGVLLLVDNAHGAYLKFLDNSLHPIDLGADLCCDSAHKTLPVLTGGAYLHLGKNAPEILKSHAENAMSLYASTSPSYLIMQSLDMANDYIDRRIKSDISKIAYKAEKLKANLKSKGFSLIGDEPLKITIVAKKYGYTGYELYDILKEKNIVAEFCDKDFLVLMLSSFTTKRDIKKLEKALISLNRKEEIKEAPPRVYPGEQVMRPFDAVTSPFEETDADSAEGKILARSSVTCPPAVSVISCGEIIRKCDIECFKYYGIKRVYTVKK